ncbi:MAG: polyphenol oxidase family protein [Egibacteraceae bacterium]
MSRPGLTAVRREVVADDRRGFRALFSGRDLEASGAGNVSMLVGGGQPVANRARLLSALGLGLDDAVFMRQVHGAAVAVVGRGDAGRGARDHGEAVADVDALVTGAERTALVALTADCVPVVLAAAGRAVGVVHAGRRGIVAGVVANAVAALRREAGCEGGHEAVREAGPSAGAGPAVSALIGPAIGPCCYEVPSALAEQVRAAVGGPDARTRAHAPALDLPRTVERQLAAAGVDDVTTVSACTACGPGAWFSHRAAPGSGRQLTAVVRAVPPPSDRRVFLDWSA